MSSQGQATFLERNFAASSPELAALVAAKDWSQTPIGPMDQWSPALRMMVEQILGNGFAMLLWWGPQFVQIYNDAYRPVLGTKHPNSLGQPGSICWSEIWDVIGPMAERPFRGGAPSVVQDIELEIDRYGFSEETHYAFAYSPVFDDTVEGGIGGVVATVHEITEKIIGERRIRLLGELGVRAAEAKTAAEACEIAANVLAGYPQDIPFALFYMRDGGDEQAHLIAAAGLERCAVIPPRELNSVEGRLVPAIPGALTIPIPAASNECTGFLVAGVSPHLALNDDYRSFFNLIVAPIATAITNARAYEEERKRADALAEIDRAKNVFFSNVSHEFRTPLTLILGPLGELAKNADSTSAPIVDAARRNSLRLLKLVNTLLEFSRIEAGQSDATFVETDLGALTAELCGVFRSAIESAGLKFTVDIQLSESAFVDRAMWEKIVLNLLSNALKFTLQGEICVALTKVGGHAELRIEDTGGGIPAEEIAHIFERFRRVRAVEARSHEGSGIGLALTRDLAAQHGGSIHVESAVGIGTVFRVRLPLGDGHLDVNRVLRERRPSTRASGVVDQYLAEVDSTITRAAHANQHSTGDGSRPHILLADDNGDLREYVTRILSPYYDVDTVTNGVDALSMARERRYDLVLSDIMMPKMNGMELLSSVRSDSSLADVPFVFLSARAGEEAAIEGLQHGADGYVVKPFSAEELIARIEALLRGVERREVTSVEHAIQRWFERPGDSGTSQTVFRAFADQLPVIVYQHDAGGAISYTNTAWFETTRLPRESSSYSVEAWREVVHPDDLDNLFAAGSSALPARLPYSVECRIKPADADESSYRWYLARALPQFDGNGAFRGWMGTAIDVHDAYLRQEAERSIARSFQDAALPATLPDMPGMAFSALYEPARSDARVGGDFYDAFRLMDGRVIVSIGDVAGSGLEAAATMAALRQSIRAAAYINPDPQLLLKAAEGAFAEPGAAAFASAFVAVIDPLTFSMQYANAGHPPPLVRRPDGSIVELGEDDLLLGVRVGDDHARHVKTCALEPGSLIVLYTDGLTEAAHDPATGELRLSRSVAGFDVTASSFAGSPKSIRDGVLGRDGDSPDDVAVLTVFLQERLDRAACDDVMCRRFDSGNAERAHDVRREMVSTLARRGMRNEDVFAFETIYTELVANAFRHAGSYVDVVLDMTQTYPVLHVLDSGPGFFENPKLPVELYAERGRGLFIVTALAREFLAAPRTLTRGTHARAVLCGALTSASSKRSVKGREHRSQSNPRIEDPSRTRPEFSF